MLFCGKKISYRDNKKRKEFRPSYKTNVHAISPGLDVFGASIVGSACDACFLRLLAFLHYNCM